MGVDFCGDFGAVLLDKEDEFQFDRERNSAQAGFELNSSLEGVRRVDVEDDDVRRLCSFWSSAIFLPVLFF